APANEPARAESSSPPMPAPERLPGRRPRPSSRARSIEEELEEDLLAAEIGDEAPLPKALEPLEDEGREPDFGEPPPRTRPGGERGGRGRHRDGGRGERGDRGARGDRGDRGPRQRDGRRNNRMGGDRGGRPGTGRPKPLIQDIFKRGQEVIVQVI